MRMLGLAVVVLTGCATNLSSLQTAKTLRPGQIRVAAGAGLYLPVGQAVGAIGEGVAIAKQGVTQGTADRVLTSAVALVAMPPAAGYELSARYGVANHLDVGLRYGLNAVRADAKVRVLHLGDREEEGAGRGRSFDVAIGVAGARQFVSVPALKVSRWDVELPVYVSGDVNPYFGLYAVPKYHYSHTDFGLGLLGEAGLVPGSVDTHFLGATGGVRAGLPRLSVYLELTGGRTSAKPKILGKERDLGGATLYPAIGLAGTFR